MTRLEEFLRERGRDEEAAAYASACAEVAPAAALGDAFAAKDRTNRLSMGEPWFPREPPPCGVAASRVSGAATSRQLLSWPPPASRLGGQFDYRAGLPDASRIALIA